MASALETLAGQAFGAKQYAMLGIYLQRSWIVLLLSAALLLPMYVFAAPLLAAMGQPAEVARLAGQPGRFLQSQGKNWVMAATALASFPVHVATTWLLVVRFRFGVHGAAMALNVSWGLSLVVQLAYVVGGGCPLTWTGFSRLAFADLSGFIKLSLSSGVMVCLENSYYKVLLLLTGHLKNSQLAVDALSIWVRVSNELGAGNGKGARFATIVSTANSFLIGLFFSLPALAFHDKIALVVSSSKAVIDAVDNLCVLLAISILLNGVQPVLSGVAVGSGWQTLVAYINVGSYYIIGVPVGLLLSWLFNLGVLVHSIQAIL
ncbi:Protein TRANSPARENT TESTA 12 [Triticum urartu]|uniref:Protein TRANSPARENT TESTA 12 n=1 Tax=Triticum urartu TaxID=4572 RepID=M7ZU69_TRIUA|nr:Protein TRANSPARENT TESTA 12 [Triticum urartu]